jgi:drug/metabolite transporter (DMT)-like permease
VFGLGAVMLGERATRATLAGAILALGGVTVISVGGNVHGGMIFAAATLGASFLSAYANVYLRRHAASDPFATLPPAMLLAGAVMTASGLLFERPDWHAALAPPSVLAVLYLAVMGSGIAFYLNHWLLQRLESWVVGLSALVIPVIAVAVGVVFGGETFGGREVFGAVLVASGVALALRRDRVATPSEA